jgi:hypothetical protein
MFCLWKKSPSAPCACAFRLYGPVHEILAHLSRLAPGTMVARQEGLSLACCTPFGSKLPVARLFEPAAATDRELHIHLLTDSQDARPLLAIGEAGRRADLSFRLDGHAWQSPATREMIRRFGGTALTCAQSQHLGAGAWLDEWEEDPHPDNDHTLVREARRILGGCESLEVEVKTAAHTSIARFSPSFIDADGGVLRLADRNCRHVVFADVESPDFRLHCISESHFRIERNLPIAS